MTSFPQGFSSKKFLFFALIISVLMLHKMQIPVYAEDIFEQSYLLASFQEQPPATSRGETVMRALSEAYPDRIGPVEFRNGDWAFQIRGRWFYYAQGRILPGELRRRAADYRPINFNTNYPAELSSWESTAAQRAERTRRWEEDNRSGRQPQDDRHLPRRPNYFFEALWNITNRNEAWNQQVQMNFLGRRITVHSGISEKIRRIDEIIMAEARINPAVRQWVDSLGVVEGWNWRNIASSGNRSFHSYGIAIDLLPRNLGRLATYWQWSSQFYPQWWNIPYSRRSHPPDVVIRAFESFGFIWGGKWTHFDTMHFEYRPEVFILNNIPMANFPTLSNGAGAIAQSPLPFIPRLDSRDVMFRQYMADVQAARRHVISSRRNIEEAGELLTIYSYLTQEGDDILGIAARSNIPVAALASLNRLSNARDLRAGMLLLLPSMPGIFIPETPGSELERLISSTRTEESAGVRLSIPRNGRTERFLFIPGDDFTSAERLLFQNRGF